MGFTPNDDINILQASDSSIVGAGAGDDTYIVSANTLDAGQEVTISDVQGVNTLQLIDGLSIVSSIVASNVAQLTLSNGAVININGADTFSYDVGGNALTGTTGEIQDYEAFAQDTLGVAVPAEGDAPAEGGEATIGDQPTPPEEDFTLTESAASFDEGSAATFELTGGKPNFTYSYDISGDVQADDLESGMLSGQVTTDENGEATIEIALAADRVEDGAKDLTVTMVNSSVEATVTVNDTSTENLTPVVEDAAVELDKLDAETIEGQLNATDPEEDALTYALDAPVEGLELNADGSYTFDPTANTQVNNLRYSEEPLEITANYTVTDDYEADPQSDSGTLTFTVNPAPLTYTFTPADQDVEEGFAQTYTVTASEAVDGDVDVEFKVVPTSDGTVSGETGPADFNQGQLNPEVVTIADGETTAEYIVEPFNDGETEVPETFSIEATVDGETFTLDGNVLDSTDPALIGKDFYLTNSVDTFTPTASGDNKTTIGDDTFHGTIGNETLGGVIVESRTFTTTDVLDGGQGDNVLEVTDIQDDNAGNTGGTELTNRNTTNIQTVNHASVGDVAADLTTGFNGVTSYNVTEGADVDVKVEDTTAVDVSGVVNGDAGSGAKEVFTATFAANGNNDADEIVFDGVTVTLTNENTDPAVAGAFTTDYNADGSGNYIAVDNEDGTVTFTAKEAGAVTNVEATDFVVTDDTDTNAVDVTGVTVDTQGVDGGVGAITVEGGSSQTILAEDSDYDVNATASVGEVNITSEDQGVGNISVDDGTDVTINSTSETSTGTITVGNTDAPTGAVSITANLSSEGDNLTGGAITTTGGTTVDVTVNGTITADEFADNGNTLQAGPIDVNGNGDTTTVNITQNLTNNNSSKTLTSAATKETVTVTFGALEAGEAVVIGDDNDNDGTNNDLTVGTDLTFVASKDLTAEQVAEAFAQLTTKDTQASGGVVENGYFQGSLIDSSGNENTADWISGLADGATVTFTASAAGAITDSLVVAADLDATAAPADNNAANAGDFSVEKTAGEDENVDEAAADVTAAAGAVTVTDEDAGDAGIKTITVDGFGAGSTIEADALETLTLKNGSTNIAVDTEATELTLNLDAITDNADINLDATEATITKLDVELASNSTADIVASAATAFNLSGTGVLTSSAGANLTAVEDITISGSAGLTLEGAADIATGTLQTIDASATSGAVTAKLDTGNATATETAYQGGTGVDNLTLVNDADVAGDISLGDGNDKLTLTASTTVITGTVDAGEGEDTISMDTTSADTLDTDVLNATGFENLELTGAADGETVDVKTLGFDYVTVAGMTDVVDGADTFTIDSIVSGGTVALSASVGDGVSDGTADTADTDTIKIVVNDADSSVADTLNLSLDSATGGFMDVDTVRADNVETLNISSLNDYNKMIIEADAATTIKLDGGASTELTLGASSTEVTLVDASLMTGALELTANGATAGTTVQGGSSDDVLTASGENDVLIGNAGEDTFNIFDLTDVAGGADADTFNFFTNSNLSKVSTVTDELTSGDTFNLFIDDGDGEFNFADETIVDKFYAEGAQYNATTTTDVLGRVNAAVQQTSAGEASWFNYTDNVTEEEFTYIVIDGADPAGDDDEYVAGEDTVIELVGTYDLSTEASFNATSGTLEIA